MVQENGQPDSQEIRDTVNATLEYLRQLARRDLPDGLGGTRAIGLESPQDAKGAQEPRRRTNAPASPLDILARRIGATPLTDVPATPTIPPAPDPFAPVEEPGEGEGLEDQEAPPLPASAAEDQEVKAPESVEDAREIPTPGIPSQQEDSQTGVRLTAIEGTVNQILDRERQAQDFAIPDDLERHNASDLAGGEVAEQVRGLESQIAELHAAGRKTDEFQPKLLSAEGVGFWAWITGNVKKNGTATGHATDPSTQWTYSWSEVEKTAVGYTGWSILDGGRSGTADTSTAAYNTIEDINKDKDDGAPPHLLGNSVELENLDYDTDGTYEFAPRPVANGGPVWMRPVRFVVGGTEYLEHWFSYETGVDGECD